MYRKISAHPTVREQFARTLIAQGSQTPESVEGLVKKHYTVLEQAFASLKPEEDLEPPVPEPAPPGAAARAETAVNQHFCVATQRRSCQGIRPQASKTAKNSAF